MKIMSEVIIIAIVFFVEEFIFLKIIRRIVVMTIPIKIPIAIKGV